MHPEQYKAYMSGDAKKNFEKDLNDRRQGPKTRQHSVPAGSQSGAGTQSTPTSMNVEVDGKTYSVKISYDNTAAVDSSNGHAAKKQVSGETLVEIVAPIEGNFMFTKDNSEKALQVGDSLSKGDVVGYIESMKVYNAIQADKSGQVMEICISDGSAVDEDDVLVKLG